MNVTYEVHAGSLLWGARDSMESALELYEDAKMSNSDCYVSIQKVTREYVKDEFIKYDPYKHM